MKRLAFAVFAISLSACTRTPIVKTAKAARRTVEATVSGISSGTVRAEHTAELAFGAVGRVRVVNVELGQTVQKGQILAEIENFDLQAALTRAESESRRRKNMTSGAVSESEYDSVRQSLEAARGALERSLIRAPYDGLITERNLEVGQLSQITAIIPTAPIRIVDTSPRYVRVEIDEVDLPRVKVGFTARVKVLASRREPYVGKVRKVIPFVSSIREQDRTSEVELNITAEDLLPVGASADVEIVTETREKVIAVPSRSVLGRGGDRYVFTIVDKRLQKRPLTLGLFNYDFTEVTEGIGDGESVVIPDDSAELKEGVVVEVASETKG